MESERRPFYTARAMGSTLTSLFYRIGDDWAAVFVELLLIGLCINWCAGVLQATRGTRPLRGVLVILIVATVVVRVVVAQYNWVRLELVYRYFLLGLALIALVVFQPELRRAVIRAGDVRLRRRTSPKAQLIAALVKAAGYLSRNRYGALVAIERSVDLTGWAENGTVLKAEASATLLNTIFFPNNPLHDLGVIIRGNRIVAANCQFPSLESDETDLNLGSRHLAALGMSYETDALVLVVSEETGVISLADNGKLHRFLTLDELSEELTQRLAGGGADRLPGGARYWPSRAWRVVRRSLVVVPLTAIVWYLTDQATFGDRAVRLRLQLQSNDAATIVDVLEPRPPATEAAVGPRMVDDLDADVAAFDATLRGPAREIDRLPSTPLTLTWVLPKPYSGVGAHNLAPSELAAVVGALPDLARRGLAVEADTLRTLRYTVDKRVDVRLRVAVDAGGLTPRVLRTDPAQVRASFRERDLQAIWGRSPTPGDIERFAEQQRVLAPVQDLLTTLQPGDERTLAVMLAGTVAGRPVAALEPRQVSVTLMVVGQRRTISNVEVQALVEPDLDERYRVEKLDANEWVLEVTVEGPERVLRGLTTRDIEAQAQITTDLLPPPDQASEVVLRQVEVRFIAPEGVRVLQERPIVVRVNLIPRSGAKS